MSFRIQIALLLLCQLMLFQEIEAQISAIGQSFTDPTIYPVSRLKDPIFVYNVSCRGGVNPLILLSASAPGNLDSCDYAWTAYNSVTDSFDILKKTESQVSNSQLSGIGQGGY